MSALQLEAVSKHYGAAKAVDRISFSTPSGRLVVLLGPSGCGKSTTLRMIAGLDTPSEGRILIDGRDVTSLAPAERRISMVFQSYALFPHLSVRENILFGVKVRREPAADHGKRLARVAELLGLAALLERKPSQLSGGQQQRVALGRAIIAETKVCLMDEPLSNLDAQLRQEMRREIRTLQQKLGITMVYVTHDQTEAMSMADQVVLLNAGRIEQDAPPAELYARPASVFAARFIGTPPMNIVAAPGRPGAQARGAARSTCAWSRAAASPAWCRAPSTSAPTPWSRARHRPPAHSARPSRRGSRAATSWPRARACASAGARKTATGSTPPPACAAATSPIPFPFPLESKSSGGDPP